MNIYRRYGVGLPGVVAGVLLGLSVVGSPGCKRGGRSPAHDQPATATKKTAPADPATAKVTPADSGLRSGTATVLHRVEEKDLPTVPTRFEPSGKYIAVLDEKQGCLVWSMAEQTYVGNVPAERCKDWLLAPCVSLPGDEKSAQHNDPKSCLYTPPGERTRRAPDGEQMVHWEGAKLWITRPSGPELSLKIGCAKEDCPDVIGVAFSPDSKQLALTRKRGSRIFLIDTQTGKSPKTLKLEKNEVALPELLAWGPHGLVAVIGETEAPPTEESPAPAAPAGTADGKAVKAGAAQELPAVSKAQLVLWHSPSSSRKNGPWSEEYSAESDGTTLSLDPRGRYLFETHSIRREGDIMAVIAVGEKRESPLSWKHDDGRTCSESELEEGQWRSGTWPVWETIQTDGADCSPSYSAWQIYTAPDRHGYGHVDLKQKPTADAVRVVKEDGKTVTTLHGKTARAATVVTGKIDADKRWEGTGKNSLRRLSDKEELILDEKHCAHTAAGAFDCALASFSTQTFLLGSDPLSAPVIRGEQVAHLFYHPNLIEDFFAGKPIAPAPGATGPVGLPPRLEKTALRYLDGPTANLEVTLLAHDGGDGVAGLRVWADGLPLPLNPPVTLAAETPTPVTLSIPPATCAHVRILLCNTPGLVCSPPVDVPFCTKKKHRIK